MNAYFTLMMVAPMIVLMILAMRHMFHSNAVNAVWVTGAAAVIYGNRGTSLREALRITEVS